MKESCAVFYKGERIAEEYRVVDVSKDTAVILDLDAWKIDAKITYDIGRAEGWISTICVKNYEKRGQHMGRTLICHVLKQLEETQLIRLSPSANPMPVDIINDPDGKCYGLKQEELELYFKRFSYGSEKKRILFKHEKE